MNHLQRISIAFILCLWLTSCANVQPPNGGPEDKTPPSIDSSVYMIQRTNFHDRSIGIHFSEYVDKARVNESIMLSPEKRMEFSWSGADLDVVFPDGLDSATTYALTLGTDYADAHGNKPSQSYTVVFSTGSTLDSGVIRGELQDPSPAGCFVLLYALKGILADTINPTTTKSRYKTQVGTNGLFEFRALPFGEYRLIVIRDAGHDALYTPGSDAFGTTTTPVAVQSSKPRHIMIRMEAAKDLNPPQLVEVRPRNRQRLDVVVSEAIDTSSVRAAGFRITDSVGSKSANVRAAYISTQSPQNISLITDAFETVGPWKLSVRSDSTGPTDLAGLHFIDSTSSLTFQSANDQDTTAPMLLTAPLRDSAQSVALKPDWRFVFSTALKMNDVEQRVGLFRQSQRIPVTFSWFGENILHLTPRDSLSPNTWYELRFRSTDVKDVRDRSMRDSLIRLRFQTIDTRAYGTISGDVIDSSGQTGPYIITLAMKNRIVATQRIAHSGHFSFSNIAEGEYSVDAYCDSDANGRYSAGQAFPYVLAEPFSVRHSTISLKARWSIEDIHIVIPRSEP